MNLSAPFICQFFKEPLMQVMPYVDVIFGNETVSYELLLQLFETQHCFFAQEADTFAAEQGFNTKDLKEIALRICKLPKQNESRQRVCVITNGSNPVIVAHKEEIKEFPVEKLSEDKLVDTNGAGDAFSGGFLSQYIQGQPLDVCVKCGIWAATQIVQRSGCTYDGKPTFQP